MGALVSYRNGDRCTKSSTSIWKSERLRARSPWRSNAPHLRQPSQRHKRNLATRTPLSNCFLYISPSAPDQKCSLTPGQVQKDLRAPLLGLLKQRRDGRRLFRAMLEYRHSPGREQPIELRNDDAIGLEAVLTTIQRRTRLPPGHL